MASGYYAPGGGLGIGHLGQAADRIVSEPPAQAGRPVVAVGSALAILSALGAGLSTYHGYRRNRGAIMETIGWALFGLLLPPVAVGLACAQGFGQARVARNKRRRRRGR